MLSYKDKIDYLENYLNKIEENYADSFKADVIIFIDLFDTNNTLLKFLIDINTVGEIENWITKLTSRIVIREDEMEVSEIIYDYILLG